jgi:hypothetical protein
MACAMPSTYCGTLPYRFLGKTKEAYGFGDWLKPR